MDSYEMSERLCEVCIPSGYIGKWSRLVAFADDDLKAELLNAMEGSGTYRKDVIAVAACEGTDKGNIFGIGGYLKIEAQHYIRFVLSVVDTAIRAKSVQYGTLLKKKYILTSLQHAYATLEGSTEPMTEEQVRFAKAAIVAHATHESLSIAATKDDVQYLAEHFDGLDQYLEFIVRSGDMSRSQLNMLLTTKPLLPLIDGML